jgi:hypothetical protein
VFPVRYELNLYKYLEKNSVFKGLSTGVTHTRQHACNTCEAFPLKCWSPSDDDGLLIKLFCNWKLSIVLFFLKKTHDVSETGFCLRLQVAPTQLGPMDRASPYLRTTATTQER